MKKILVIIVAICLMASMLCVPAFAANDPAAGTVLRLSAQKKNGSIVVIKDYDNFEEGWEAVVDYAEDTKTMKTNGYDRVVVDFYTDWTANEEGEFGNGGDGFEWSTIHITEDIRITLNLNNHTINRNLKEWEYDGEVIYIDENADVIINDGTISGGWSCNGAGGIHICEKARVVLNNVNIVGNNVDDDDGAGIAVYKGAILTMNGGSFRNNVTDGVDAGAVQGAAAYVEEGTATFNNVLFKNNQSFITYAEGMAIYATKATVTVNNCTFEENGIANTEKGFTRPITLIGADASSMTIKASTFKGNECYQTFNAEDSDFVIEGCQITGNKGSELFTMQDSFGNIKDVTITGNTSHSIFHVVDTELDVTNATITDNVGQTLYIYNCDDEIVTMTNCILGNNTQPSETTPDVYIIEENTIVFVDSTLGDTTFNDEDLVKVIYSGVAKEDAAISVTKLFKDGTNETVYYRFFEYGWNLAMEAALTHDYERIIVDLYGDWNAVDGQFTDEFNNGAGFDWDAIYVPKNARVTINMNGHTINRGLTDGEDNGEVMYVDEGADLIINGGKSGDAITRGDDTGATVQFGTISGGYSENGAGGIHINGAHVELNNVKVKGNATEYDDGAGIAAYDATVIIRGGSLIDNTIDSVTLMFFCYGGGIYAEDSTVTMEKVEVKNNQTLDSWNSGMGVYAEDSVVTIDQCIFDGNGVGDTSGDRPYPGYSTIYANDSIVTITKTTFINNGSPDGTGLGDSVLFELYADAHLEIDECVIKNNAPKFLFDIGGTGRANCSFYIKNSTITDNKSAVISEDIYVSGCFENCTLNNNEFPDAHIDDFSPVSKLVLRNCSMGDSSYDDYRLENSIEFQDADGNAIAVGSIFGEGSLTNILVIVSLIASAVSIFLTVYYNKKKTVPAATAATEDEE